ncbi:hypothetical protein KKG24_05240 [Patescibacteria group bacterium]|nr:hypothetical protein [Patescibacteria group bacterium]
MNARELRALGVTGDDARGSILEVTMSDSPRRQYLEKKWGRLLSGHSSRVKKLSEGSFLRAHTAILLENQAASMRSLVEATGMTATPEYVKHLFPIIRKVWSKLVAYELFGSQPMSGPVGGLFYYRLLYQLAKGGIAAGTEAIANFDETYSSEYIKGELIGTGDGAKWGGAGAALAYVMTFLPVKPKDAYGAKVVIREETVAGVVVQSAEDDGASGFTGAVQAGATINYTTGAVAGFKFTAAPIAGNLVKTYYWYTSEFSSQVPEMGSQIILEAIKAETRKLKTKWSLEGAQDMKAMLDIDVDSDLSMGMESELSLELDHSTIMLSVEGATGGADQWDRQVPAGISEIDHLKTIVTKISGLSMGIQKKVKRGPANRIVVSPEIMGILNVLPTFKRTGDLDGEMGVNEVGTLNESWRVFGDPNFPASKLEVLRQGRTFVEQGLVVSTYVPLLITPAVLDPGNFSIVKGMMHRGKSKVTNGDYFAVLTVLNS